MARDVNSRSFLLISKFSTLTNMISILNLSLYSILVFNNKNPLKLLSITSYSYQLSLFIASACAGRTNRLDPTAMLYSRHTFFAQPHMFMVVL